MLFSIVTVVKNDLKGLQLTRKSLEKQTYKKWHHVIIDGNSGKKTRDYLNSLPKTNTIFLSEADSGIYDAMNKGWKIAHQNSFIIYLNARDEFATVDSLKFTKKALVENRNCHWGCTTHEEKSEKGDYWVGKLVSPPSVRNQLYAYGYRSHQAVVMKQKFIEQLGGFDLKYSIAADWDLMVRALLTEKPAVWKHPIAIFKLGGLSSKRMMVAHQELRSLRRKYLNPNGFELLFEFIWSLIYLREFGYARRLQRLIDASSNLKRVIVSSLKKSRSVRNRSKKRFSRGLARFANLKISLIKIEIMVQFKWRHPEKNTRVRAVLRKVRYRIWILTLQFRFWLNRKLKLNPYQSDSE